MIVKKRYQALAVTFISTMLIAHLSGCGTTGSRMDTANSNIKQLKAGQQWVLTETTKLSNLTIAEGATITAPEGYNVTMTINHVGTEIKPGKYKGDIMLTVAEDINVRYEAMGFPGAPPTILDHIFRTGIYIKDGEYVVEKSVAAIVEGGEVTDAFAEDIKITSNEEKFNGIMVTGDSTFSIRNPKINFTGNGGNDFAGFGAAIMSSGTADVTVDNAEIITNGAIRTTVWVGGDSTMKVNNSYLETNNGTLPEDYEFTIEMGKMMEVPWMLGLTGNCRATNLLDNGTAYYNNTHIKAQAWGALSTDQTKKVRLYVKDSLIETVESGYGAYSIGDSIDTFDGCEINVADMALIIANGEASGVFTNGTVVNSGRFGVMVHSNQSGTLTIDKGCVFNTEEAVIQVKGSTPTIVVDNSELNSKNGIILQLMENDDPFMAVMMAKGPPPGGPGGPPPGGPDGPPPGGPGGPPGGSRDVTATFSNMTLKGDIINGKTGSSDLIVSFKNAMITGAITTATTTFKYEEKGMNAIEFFETGDYSLIGEVKNRYEAKKGDKYGLKVSLDSDTKWVVNKTSFLTGLTIANGAAITGPKGFKVTMTVNGVVKPIAAGTYTGQIVLAVN